MPRAEMLARMSSRELSEWMAYAGIEPFGNERAAMATQTAVIANAFTDAKKRPKPFTTEDFLFGQPDPDDLAPDEVSDKIAKLLGAPT